MQVVVVGAGGLGREVRELVTDCGHDFAGFLDDASDRPVRSLADLPESVGYVIGIGDGTVRAKITTTLGREPVTLVHPSAYVGARTVLGPGTVVLPGAVVSCDVTIGAHCLVYYGATIGHDTVLEDYVSLYPGANVAGGTRLCERVTVGAGASVIQQLTVGAGTFVGSGAVVIRDLPEGVTAVGVPTRSS